MRSCSRPAVLLALGLSTLALAQLPEAPAVTFPELPHSASSVAAFVPKGWALEQQLTEDFDGDGRPDALLLLRLNDAANVLRDGDRPALDTNPRLLAGVLGGAKGYTLAFANHALIPRHDSPTIDDPFGRLEAAKNGFDLELSSFASMGTWWAGTTKFRFRYEGRCFRLIGYESSSYHRASLESSATSVNYLTGRVETTHTAQEGAKPEIGHSRRSPNPVVCIEALGDGFEFDPVKAAARP